eukprot:8759306-Pyramimonas_sp.AAC.1
MFQGSIFGIAQPVPIPTGPWHLGPTIQPPPSWGQAPRSGKGGGKSASRSQATPVVVGWVSSDGATTRIHPFQS